jgi:hypothetical protein
VIAVMLLLSDYWTGAQYSQAANFRESYAAKTTAYN